MATFAQVHVPASGTTSDELRVAKLNAMHVGPVGHDVACVDDQLRVIPQRLVDELAVRGEHHDAVRCLELLGRQRDRMVLDIVELGRDRRTGRNSARRRRARAAGA